jgi:hypothetical protein
MSKKATLSEFIVKAENIHKKFYTYENAVYVDALTKLSITCKEHGEFWQTPGDHVYGHGCPQCKAFKRSCKWTDIILLFQEKHNGYYSYDETTYIRNSIKMRIICPVHGEFWQKPELHKNGSGCKLCTASGGPGKYCETIFNRNPELKLKNGYLYFIELHDADGSKFYKIGITVSMKNRFYKFIEKNNGKICWINEDTLYNCFLKEQYVLKKYKHVSYIPSSLKIGGKHECFSKELYTDDI